MIIKKYKINKLIDKNNLFDIYSGNIIDSKDNIKITVLLSTINNPNILNNEISFFKNNFKHRGIPLLIDYEINDNLSYIILEDIGNSLNNLYKLSNYKFNKYTYYSILVEILEIIKITMKNNIFYNNFSMNSLFIKVDKNNINWFILDFRNSNKFNFLNKFSSIDFHNGCYNSKRGELESVFYLMNYLKNKNLSWINIKNSDSILLKNNFKLWFYKTNIWYNLINEDLNINNLLDIFKKELEPLSLKLYSWDIISLNHLDFDEQLDYYSLFKNKPVEFLDLIKNLKTKNDLIYKGNNIKLEKFSKDKCFIF